MFWAKIGCVMMMAGVFLGAFSAHALRSKLSEHAFDIFRTGVLYHLIHALALFVVAWLKIQVADPRMDWAGIFIFAGIVLFSGSLYILSVTGQKWLGAVTPFGGLSFLTGWFLIMVILWKQGQ